MNKKNKRTKFIEPKMEFNPGTQKYEPVLPLKKTGKKVKIKMSLINKIIGITILALMIILIIYLSIK